MNRETFVQSVPQSHELLEAQLAHLVNSSVSMPADPVPGSEARIDGSAVEDTLQIGAGCAIATRASRTWSVLEDLYTDWTNVDPHPHVDIRHDAIFDAFESSRRHIVGWATEQIAYAVRCQKPVWITSDQALTLDPQAVYAEAVDEGFDQPPDEALAGAKRVLQSFPFLRNLETDIYPTPDAEVAILVSGSRPCSSVLLQCDGGRSSAVFR